MEILFSAKHSCRPESTVDNGEYKREQLKVGLYDSHNVILLTQGLIWTHS